MCHSPGQMSPLKATSCHPLAQKSLGALLSALWHVDLRAFARPVLSRSVINQALCQPAFWQLSASSLHHHLPPPCVVHFYCCYELCINTYPFKRSLATPDHSLCLIHSLRLSVSLSLLSHVPNSKTAFHSPPSQKPLALDLLCVVIFQRHTLAPTCQGTFLVSVLTRRLFWQVTALKTLSNALLHDACTDGLLDFC